MGIMGAAEESLDADDPMVMSDNRGAYFDGNSFIKVQGLSDVSIEKAFSIVLWSKGAPGTYFAHKSSVSSMYIRLACDATSIRFSLNS